MSVVFSTTEYQFAHGKMPRGYGHWAFFFDNETVPFWHTGKFSEAKRSAIALAVSRGYSRVIVGS